MSSALPPQIQTTCPYCGVGCGVTATIDKGRVTAVSGTQDHPANKGRLCVKGSALHETLGEHGRLLHPQINSCRTDWNTALDVVAAGFSDIIKRHGPDSVAFYLSGQLLTEDYYVANKLMKGFIGTANVDTNSRLCMASAVAGYQRGLGADAVPCTYEDLENCDLLIMVGSNAAWTHPVLFQRISTAKQQRPEMKVVVIDPRRTATCELADLHLRIAPGSDGFVFTGLLRFLSEKKCLNEDFTAAHTEGFAAAMDCTQDLETTAKKADVDIGELEQFYRWFARTEKTVTFYSQGINQSATGTDKCNAIINCHLATGRIGKEGMGPFSITGQPNAMGGREVGGLANQLAAHMDFAEENVDRMARFWQSDSIANKPGLKAVDMFNAIDSGEIKAIWIMATNPVVSLPDPQRVRAALKKCELVVVSDCIEKTDTTVCAHVLLPASGWGEKDGTVTNSERCISRQRALLPAAGDAKPDWWMICEVAKRMGFAQHFAFTSPAEIFREHARLSGFENDPLSNARRVFDISALATLDDEQFEHLSPIRWPLPASCNGNQLSTPLLNDNRFYTANGKARFIAVTAQMPQLPTEPLPYTLNTGRVRDQWHTMTRTARAPRLLNHTDAPYLALNPLDALSTGIGDGDLVRVKNSQAELMMTAVLDTGQRPGEVFVPIHWSAQFAAHGRVNELISSVTDPHSGQPESKFAQLTLQLAPVCCWVHLISREELDVSVFFYWVKIPVAKGWRYLLAIRQEPNKESHNSATNILQTLNDFLLPSTSGLQRIELTNTATTDYRALFCQRDQIHIAAFSAVKRNSLPDTARMNALLDHQVGADSWRLLNVSGSGPGRIICSCYQVSESAIVNAVRNGAKTPAELGRLLRCGSNCGSCIPELKQLLHRTEKSTEK